MFAHRNTNTLLLTAPVNIPFQVVLVTESIMIVSANPSSNTILPTVQEKTNPVGLPAAESIILVPFVPNVPSRLKTVLTAVPDTTPVTGVLPVSLIRPVT